MYSPETKKSITKNNLRGITDPDEVKNNKQDLVNKFKKKQNEIATKPKNDTNSKGPAVPKDLERKYNKLKKQNIEYNKTILAKSKALKELENNSKNQLELSDVKNVKLQKELDKLQAENASLTLKVNQRKTNNSKYLQQVLDDNSDLTSKLDSAVLELATTKDLLSTTEYRLETSDKEVKALSKNNVTKQDMFRLKLKNKEIEKRALDYKRELITTKAALKSVRREKMVSRNSITTEKVANYINRATHKFKNGDKHHNTEAEAAQMLTELGGMVEVLEKARGLYLSIISNYRNTKATNVVVYYDSTAKRLVDYSTRESFELDSVKVRLKGEVVDNTHKQLSPSHVYAGVYKPFVNRLDLLEDLDKARFAYTSDAQMVLDATEKLQKFNKETTAAETDIFNKNIDLKTRNAKLTKYRKHTKQPTLEELFNISSTDANWVNEKLKSTKVLYVADASNRRKQMLQSYGVDLTEVSPYEYSYNAIETQVFSNQYDLVFVDLGYIDHSLYYKLNKTMLGNTDQDIYNVYKLGKEALLVSILSVIVKQHARASLKPVPVSLIKSLEKSIRGGLLNNKSANVPLDEKFLKFLGSDSMASKS